MDVSAHERINVVTAGAIAVMSSFGRNRATKCGIVQSRPGRSLGTDDIVF